MSRISQASEFERLEYERTIPIERYQEDGCNTREEYLREVADNHGLNIDTIITLASLLGGDEDFDGLIGMAEDAEAMGEL